MVFINRFVDILYEDAEKPGTDETFSGLFLKSPFCHQSSA
jgi:hypothetical protein